MFEFWIQIAPIVILLILGFTVGGMVERAHFRRIEAREEEIRHIRVTDIGKVPPSGARALGLVTGEVVVASDYFKSFAAALRKLIGGELRTYDSLMERGRREALLRMLESAQQMGANQVINVRFSTSNIGAVRRKNAAAMVEVYAAGTALHVPS